MSFPSLRTRQEPIMVSKKMANGTEYRVYGQDGKYFLAEISGQHKRVLTDFLTFKEARIALSKEAHRRGVDVEQTRGEILLEKIKGILADGLLEEEENVLVSMAVSDFKAFHQNIGSNG